MIHLTLVNSEQANASKAQILVELCGNGQVSGQTINILRQDDIKEVRICIRLKLFKRWTIARPTAHGGICIYVHHRPASLLGVFTSFTLLVNQGSFFLHIRRIAAVDHATSHSDPPSFIMSASFKKSSADCRPNRRLRSNRASSSLSGWCAVFEFRCCGLVRWDSIIRPVLRSEFSTLSSS